MNKPYIIFSPPYTDSSAGVKALHFLCDALRAAGEEASIARMDMSCKTVSDDSIVIYPEIVDGNPLQAKHVVRWLLYYAGCYRGNYRFPETDMVWGYTKRIARDYGTNNVLFLPTVNENIFVPPPEGTKRNGSCFYARKYKWIFNGPLHGTTNQSVEITNPGQSREEIIRLLQTSEIFYAYEDTALLIESVLCGCPAVFIPNPKFPECCGMEEFSAGIAEGADNIVFALESVSGARSAYTAIKESFPVALNNFIKSTQLINVDC